MRSTILAAVLCAAMAGCSASAIETPPAAAITLPPVTAPAGVTLSALPTGYIHSRAALTYKGGGFGDKRTLVVGAILVRHPQGDLLFDAGFGRDAKEHYKTTPLLMRLASRYDLTTPAADQLKAAGIDPTGLKGVVLTHLHFDHISGLEHLPGAPVMLPASEVEFAGSGDRAAKLAHRMELQKHEGFSFDGPAYLGFPASHDVFGDGTVVLVPAAGHTPGSVIAFVATSDGKRYALIGDTAWQSEGVTLPAEKPWPASIADHDGAGVREQLIRLHQLHEAAPELIIVPAHDTRVWNTLPQLAAKP